MATTDIVARLQLRAEQFSSETGTAFAEMKARARSTAQDVRGSFGSAFADVQKLAQTSLQMPRTAAGGLDLSREISQLNAAAMAAEENAAAQRALSAAFLSSSTHVGADTQAHKLNADAAMVAAAASDREATALRAKAAMYEATQRELDQTTVATRELSAAQGQLGSAARGARGNLSMVGAQAVDFTTQVQGGTAVATAFSQQLGQMGFALQMAGGRLAGVGAFLTGPWGTALTIATMVAAPFVAKLWEAKDAGSAAASGVDEYVAALKRLQAQAGAFSFGSEEFGKVNQAALQAEARVGRLQAELAKARAAGPAIMTPGAPTAITNQTRTRDLVQVELNQAIAARDKARSDLNALLIQRRNREVLNADAPPKASSGRADRGPTASSVAARDESVRDAQDKLAAIRDRFTEVPAQVRTVRDSLREVDDVIRGLSQRKGVGFEKAIEQAEALKPLIREALNKPFDDYIDQQRESLAIDQLTLAGRDAEAEAMQAALRVQEQQGELSEAQLATLLRVAQQHERIKEALEDQQRIVGIYSGMVGDLQTSFRGFLDDLDGNTGSALKGLFSNWAADLKAMQRNLLSNALFGGVDREVEKYVKAMTGRKTPAEMLVDQAGDAGIELRKRVNESGDALADFVSVVRSATLHLGGAGSSGLGSLSPVGDGRAIGDAIARSLVREAFDNVAVNLAASRGETYDPNTIIVTAQIDKIGAGAGKLVKASDVLGVTIDGIAGNLRRNLGVEVPREIISALKSGIPTVLEGLSFGQLGGSVFSSITGGKDDKLASSIGGVLGDVAGKSLAKPIAGLIGGTLGKTLGGAAGPIGSIVGGILGNMVSGLFNKPQYGTAILSNATDKVSASGRGSSSTKAASGLAGSVQQGLTQLADQLGATLGNFDTVVGMFDGKYRVRTTAAGWDGKGALDFKGNSKNNLYDFGDDAQAAIQFAIADAVRDGAIQGLSAASSRILQSGQDLGKAVEKVTLIESIPKDLKAMLDPVGAALDAFNLKWKRTVDALKEGGASAEQVAQAERLYTLQREQLINSTASATATLRDYRDSLMLGSNSPYSLRDQEATAISKLTPYLTQIAGGQSIDQEKYRQAADAYLAVEREMYGSTQAYFDALDTVQAATNKAITAIENVAPITPAVESPFAKATADSTSSTAKAATTLTEQTDETNALLARITAQLERLGAGSSGSDFVGSARNFLSKSVG